MLLVLGSVSSLVLALIATWAVLSTHVKDCLGVRCGLVGLSVTGFFFALHPSLMAAVWMLFFAAWLAVAAVLRRFTRTLKRRPV